MRFTYDPLSESVQFSANGSKVVRNSTTVVRKEVNQLSRADIPILYGQGVSPRRPLTDKEHDHASKSLRIAFQLGE